MLSVDTPGTDASGADASGPDKLVEWTCSVIDDLARRGITQAHQQVGGADIDDMARRGSTQAHQQVGGAVVGVPATCVAQLVQTPKTPKIPVTPDVFRRDQYNSHQEYMDTVYSSCMAKFSCRKLSREEHVSLAKDYVSKNFEEGDKIHDHVSKLRDFSLCYDTGNFDTSKNTLGHYNYTTRFFNHIMKLFYILACLEKAAYSYAGSRKRKLHETFYSNDGCTEAEKEEICSLWGDRCKEKIMGIGMEAVMKAHIEYMNTSGDMQFICAIMIMNEAVFGNKSPKYDLPSLIDIAACYDNVCNWFNYLETNKVSSGDFVMEEDRPSFDRIMSRAIDHPMIPELIRNNYKQFLNIERSSDPDKKMRASVMVGKIRRDMLARWNAYTTKFGVATKVHPSPTGKKAKPSAVLALTMAP